MITKKILQTGKKLLVEYERLANKYNLSISSAKLKQLNAKRDMGVIKSADLPPKLRNEMPKELENMTLDEIKEMLKRL